MQAERIEVLKMIQSKQISAEDGARLLKALVADRNGSGAVAATRPTAPPVPPAGGSRWFKVDIAEPSGERINFSLPLQTVPSVMRYAARWVPAEHRDALDAAADAIRSGYRGDLIRIERPSGERVHIWIE